MFYKSGESLPGVFRMTRSDDSAKLFNKILSEEDEAEQFASKDVIAGEIDLLFSHPEGLLSDN